MAGVLGCTEDSDGVGWLGVILTGDGGDLLVDPDAPCCGDEQNQREQPAENETAPSGALASQIGRRGDHRG